MDLVEALVLTFLLIVVPVVILGALLVGVLDSVGLLAWIGAKLWNIRARIAILRFIWSLPFKVPFSATGRQIVILLDEKFSGLSGEVQNATLLRLRKMCRFGYYSLYQGHEAMRRQEDEHAYRTGTFWLLIPADDPSVSALLELKDPRGLLNAETDFNRTSEPEDAVSSRRLSSLALALSMPLGDSQS